jgi:ankyrin repeat protein
MKRFLPFSIVAVGLALALTMYVLFRSACPRGLALKLVQPPIHQAVERGALNEVRRRLDQGTPVDLRNERGDTPLHTAVSQRQWRIADLLHKRGADVNARDNEGISIIGWQHSFDNQEGIKWLLKHGAKDEPLPPND